MNPAATRAISESERMVRDGAQGFVAAHHSMQRVRQMRTTEAGYAREVWMALAEAGWLGLRAPESMGGAGMSMSEVAAVCQVFGEALLPEPYIACGLIPASLLAGCGNASLRQRLLPGVLAGRIVLTLAWQEAPFHFDADRCQLTLSGTGSSLWLRGSKHFVASAPGADGYIVSCMHAGQFALVHVPASAAGIGMHAHRQMDGSVCADLNFADVDISAGDILAEGEAARDLIRSVMDEATLAVCATLTAVADRALALTVDYMGKRVQFGKLIGSFQSLQHRAVDLAVRSTLAGASMRRALEEHASGSARAAADLSAAKALCSRAATLVTRSAIQLHGGIGYTDECDIGLYLKSALRLAGYMGTAQSHSDRYAALNSADGEGP